MTIRIQVAVNIREDKIMVAFPEFEKRIGDILRRGIGPEDKEEIKRLLCADCQFFTPGEDEELECGCYNILARLIDKGLVTLEQLADALK